ncbi:MAG TPA: hypothetical protein VGP47_06765 [Parachlamydiaceae bacterium]|nr:hypothetical protein [Parachlamydiaceae bacterium]
MTPSTSAMSSYQSTLWDLFSSIDKGSEIGALDDANKKAAFEKVWQGASTVFEYYKNATSSTPDFEGIAANKTFTQMYGGSVYQKIMACVTHRDVCIEKFSNYLVTDFPSEAAYHLPKVAFETATSLTLWTGRKIFNVGERIAGWINPAETQCPVPISPSITDLIKPLAETQCPAPISPPIFESLLKIFNEQTNTLSEDATRWITGRTAEPITYDNQNPFRASNLIGASLALAWCSHKASENLWDTVHRATLLVTNLRLLSISHPNTSINSSTPTVITKTKMYTTTGLVVDVVMQSIFTGVWSASAYLIHKGIYNEVLTAAAGSSEHAKWTADAIVAAGIGIPLLCKFIKKALNAPVSAPLPPVTSRIVHQISAETLAFDEAMELLIRHRPVKIEAK